METYTVQYQVQLPDGKIENGSMDVIADDAPRAKEYAEHIIEEKYPEDTLLLECSVD